MSLLLFVGIIILAATRFYRMPNLWTAYPLNGDTVFAGFYVLWLVGEAPIARRDVGTEGKRTADGATCELYACAQAFTFLSALWFPSVWHAPSLAHFVGMSLFLFGVSYRLWAIRTLGVLFTPHPHRVPAQHSGFRSIRCNQTSRLRRHDHRQRRCGPLFPQLGDLECLSGCSGARDHSADCDGRADALRNWRIR